MRLKRREMKMKEVNDLNGFIVDKENEQVIYNDKLHEYRTKANHAKCISVTTLIHKFVPPFDEEFWSAYKAIEALVPKDIFKDVKKTLLQYKLFNIKILDKLKISTKDFEKKRKEILAEWKEKNEVACERGTKIHLEEEMKHYKGDSPEIKKLGLGGKFDVISTNKIVPGEKGVYPELLLSRVSEDGILRVAGQADLIIIDDWDVYVLDTKTNKSIDLKSYYDPKTKKFSTMLYPLNNIQDSNFWHYSLQLSLYAWLIKKIDPRFNIKKLILMHHDHDGNYTEHECEYLEKEVEAMLLYYKKQLKHEKFKESRVSIHS